MQAPEAQDAFQRGRQPLPRLAQPLRPQVQLAWARAAAPVPKTSVGPPPPTLVPAFTAPPITELKGYPCSPWGKYPPPKHTHPGSISYR